MLVLSTLAALGASLLTTAKYAASTQLFVSTTAQGAAAAYEGGLFSQQRVTSYSQLIQGGQVAQRVVDSLKLKISAARIASEVSVAVVPNTVILTVTVTVTDPSPERARDIVNALSVEFTELAAEPETPQGGTAATTKVTVVQKASLARATVHPERTPTEHGSPPPRGVGTTCDERSLGRSTTPRCTRSLRTTGQTAAVTAALTTSSITTPEPGPSTKRGLSLAWTPGASRRRRPPGR